MASYALLAAISKAAGFQARVDFAMMNGALAVIAEDPATVGHAARVVYARKVLVNDYMLPRVTMGVLENVTIGAEARVDDSGTGDNGVPDSDLQFAVNSLWNAFAGV